MHEHVLGQTSADVFQEILMSVTERGVLKSEKTLRDRRRPCNRLVLVDDRLRDADVADLATTAQAIPTNDA